MKCHFLIDAVFATLFFVTANGQSVTDKNVSIFNKDSLGKEISILASDDFQGRKHFTIGERESIDYLKNKFQSMG